MVPPRALHSRAAIATPSWGSPCTQGIGRGARGVKSWAGGRPVSRIAPWPSPPRPGGAPAPRRSGRPCRGGGRSLRCYRNPTDHALGPLHRLALVQRRLRQLRAAPDPPDARRGPRRLVREPLGASADPAAGISSSVRPRPACAGARRSPGPSAQPSRRSPSRRARAGLPTAVAAFRLDRDFYLSRSTKVICLNRSGELGRAARVVRRVLGRRGGDPVSAMNDPIPHRAEELRESRPIGRDAY